MIPPSTSTSTGLPTSWSVVNTDIINLIRPPMHDTQTHRHRTENRLLRTHNLALAIQFLVQLFFGEQFWSLVHKIWLSGHFNQSHQKGRKTGWKDLHLQYIIGGQKIPTLISVYYSWTYKNRIFAICSRSSMAPSSHYNILFAPRYLELKDPKPGLQPRVPRPRRGSSRRQRVPAPATQLCQPCLDNVPG